MNPLSSAELNNLWFGFRARPCQGRHNLRQRLFSQSIYSLVQLLACKRLCERNRFQLRFAHPKLNRRYVPLGKSFLFRMNTFPDCEATTSSNFSSSKILWSRQEEPPTRE